MFDLGFSELLLTAVVALLVLGPERLPRAAKMAGLWIRRARATWYGMRAQLERELADDELRRSLQNTRNELRHLQQQLGAPVQPDTARPTVQALPAGGPDPAAGDTATSDAAAATAGRAESNAAAPTDRDPAAVTGDRLARTPPRDPA